MIHCDWSFGSYKCYSQIFSIWKRSLTLKPDWNGGKRPISLKNKNTTVVRPVMSSVIHPAWPLWTYQLSSKLWLTVVIHQWQVINQSKRKLRAPGRSHGDRDGRGSSPSLLLCTMCISVQISPSVRLGSVCFPSVPQRLSSSQVLIGCKWLDALAGVDIPGWALLAHPYPAVWQNAVFIEWLYVSSNYFGGFLFSLSAYSLY